MQTSMLMIACLVVAEATNAQFSLVAPNGYASVEGSSSNSFPWNTSSSNAHIQWLYDSSHFTAQGFNHPLRISGIRFRADAAATSVTWGGGSWPNVVIDVGPAAVDYMGTTTTFASNRGSGMVNVLSGAVTVQAGAGNGALVPGPWYIHIPFARHVLYDPSTGDDLLIDVLKTGLGWSGTSRNADTINDTGTPPSRGRRVYATGTTALTAVTGQLDSNVPVIEFTYEPDVEPFGSGCGPQYGRASFYELFAPGSMDLSNSALTMVKSRSGYVVQRGIAAYIAPSAAATTLALTDDGEVSVPLGSSFPITGGTTSNLTVCSNGFVSVSGGNGTGFAPSSVLMLDMPQTAWWCWHDYNPARAGSGQVKFEQVGGNACVTWDGVMDFDSTSSATSTWQFQFDLGSGDVRFVWRTMSLGGNQSHDRNRYLVGYSPGGASLDPGNRDISATLTETFSLWLHDSGPLLLSVSDRPTAGNTISMSTSHISPTAEFGAMLVGLMVWNPAVNLGGIGMTGCYQYSRFDVMSPLSFPNGGPRMNTSLGLPNYPGIDIYCQSAVYDPMLGLNPIGAYTSNGVRLHIVPY